jgi:hypothetical protein
VDCGESSAWPGLKLAEAEAQELGEIDAALKSRSSMLRFRANVIKN